MTTATLPAVTFLRVLRSETIKIRTLRSTVWTAALAVVLSAGVMGMIVLGVTLASDEGPAAVAAATTDAFGPTPTLGAIGFAFAIAQVAVALLGTLVVTTERATGLITSTVPAVPTRLPIVLAKLGLVACVGTVLGILTGVTAFVIAEPAFAVHGAHQALLDPASIRVILGGGLYIGIAGTIGVAIAFLLRSALAAAGAALGLLLVLPSVVQLLPLIGRPVSAALPAALGGVLYSPASTGQDLVVALAGLIAWVVTAALAACVSFTRRDV